MRFSVVGVTLSLFLTTLVAGCGHTDSPLNAAQLTQNSMYRAAHHTTSDDISTIERTTFNGFVTDRQGNPLSGVRISVASLNASVHYQSTTTTAGGAYAFNNAPAGIQIAITAVSGMASQRRVEVLKSNQQGDPNANRFNFVLQSPVPVPSATTDHSVIEKTTFNGSVKDQFGVPLDGVRVSVSSLNAAVPYRATTTTVAGVYAFNNAPAGIQIEITAASAMASLRRIEVLKSNPQGDPSANRYDFLLPKTR